MSHAMFGTYLWLKTIFDISSLSKLQITGLLSCVHLAILFLQDKLFAGSI